MRKRRENLTAALFFYNGIHSPLYHDPNDGTSSYIEKTRFISYELPKLLLIGDSSFTGREAFRLNRFTVVQIRDVFLYCSFGVLLQSDAKLLLRSETPTLPVT